MFVTSVRRMLLPLFITLFLTPALILAQSDLCPEIVQAALSQTDENCQGTNRNQACYGNISLEVEPQDGIPDFSFSQPGDLADLAGIQTLTLNPLSEAENTWGIALMRIQANLPDTLPGQNVTFLLFGDVAIQNAVESNAEPIIFEVTADGDINVRSGPTTNDSVVSSLANGDTVTANGRNPESDWLRVELANGEPGWIFAELVTTEGDISTLDIVDPLALVGPLNPMQAFYFQSGIGDAPCEQAPDSGILIQTPEGAAEINLVVDEVNIQLGSTIYLQAQPGGDMTVQTIEGLARVSAFGVTQTGLAGTIISVPIDNNLAASGPPNPPQSYNDAALQALPIQLLEREIVIAPPLPEDKLVLGEGDIQFTLSWNSIADMDLHVIEPEGEHIYFGTRESSIGGELDVDSNFPCGDNGGSVENIYWPEGEAPSGTFQVMIDEFSSCDGGVPDWTLTVQVDGVVVYTQRGSGDGPVLEFDFSPDTLLLEFIGEGTTGDFDAFNSGDISSTLDPDAAENASPIELGQIVTDELTANSADYWTFQAMEGQAVTVIMREANGSGLDTYLVLYGPDGTFLTSNDDFDNLNSQIGPFPLPSTGTYIIEARGFSNSDGAYELSVDLTEIEPPFVGEINFGDIVERTLQINSQDTYTFEAEAGQTIKINMSSPNFDTYLELLGPDGQTVATNDDFEGLNSQIGPIELTETGTYTIIARALSSSGSGDYELTLNEG
jgi:hypothetical protein